MDAAELEHLLQTSLNFYKEFIPDKDWNDVRDYIDYGEFGVAYELLTFVLDERKLERSVLLMKAGSIMGCDN